MRLNSLVFLLYKVKIFWDNGGHVFYRIAFYGGVIYQSYVIVQGGWHMISLPLYAIAFIKGYLAAIICVRTLPRVIITLTYNVAAKLDYWQFKRLNSR